MVESPDAWSDCSAFVRKYNCQIIATFGSLLGAAIIAGLTWFVVEYRNQQLAIQANQMVSDTTKAALETHTAMETEHYKDTMEVLGSLNSSMQQVQTQLSIMDFRLNGTIGAPRSPQQVDHTAPVAASRPHELP